eukprot:1558550-Karenia_brevis.AAC.1
MKPLRSIGLSNMSMGQTARYVAHLMVMAVGTCRSTAKHGFLSIHTIEDQNVGFASTKSILDRPTAGE